MRKILLYTLFVALLLASKNHIFAASISLSQETQIPDEISSDDSCLPVSLPDKMNNISLYALYSYLYKNTSDCTRDPDIISFTYDGNNVTLQNGEGWQPCNYSSASSNPDVKSSIPAFFVASNTKIDQLCVFVWLANDGYYPISCKRNSNNPKKPNNTLNNCATEAIDNSAYVFNISSIAVNCSKQALESILGNTTSTKNPHNLYFGEFQKNFRSIIFYALTIFVIFQGYKVAMNHQITTKTEWFIFCFKYLMVMYFATGFHLVSSPHVENSPYVGGMQDIFIPLVIDALNAFSMFGQDLFSNIMSTATNSPNTEFCNFSSVDYNPKYSYLRIWDTIDCKLISYLGITVNSSGKIISFGAIPLIILCMFFFGILCGFLIILLLSYVISLMIFSVVFYIISLTILTLLIFVSPIIIPFVLFDKTKSIFQDWLKLVISYTLQPMIVISFCTMIFTITDKLYFPGCQWTKEESTTQQEFYSSNNQVSTGSTCAPFQLSSIAPPLPTITPPTPSKTSSTTKYTYIFNSSEVNGSYSTPSGDFKLLCTESFGAFMQNPVMSVYHALLYKAFYPSSIWKIIKSLIFSAIVFIIATRISKNIARFAADITSGVDLTDVGFKANALYELAKKTFANKIGNSFDKK
jgi:type IV secretory pathway VirB6-like protein